ncbi:hypothetical protein [Mycetocola reblochoni]|uniref:Glycosyltransferase RgtA/B/C/D-like domain-containing protein n=2 Tax=Mycetocola reblochoni TaxID=331618 RepID=A0A1R4K0Y8_9MICO|nr:hypothetical protein [Mycetocola reblochoni]RLP70462.1 hypothetical protein D9V30_02850 [Mycetocola reblochoni]SJN37946.1 hypothetical protein FM119_10715 [Mycetocola reblochoni REB411]
MTVTAELVPTNLEDAAVVGRSRARRRVWPALAVVAVVTAAVLHILVARSAVTPAFPYDEITIFALAKYVAGEPVTLVASGGYFPLWAFLIAPLWWISSDPATVYAGATAIGVVLAVATIWPLSLLVRRVGLSRAQSVAVAAIVMCMPARTLQADYAMSEKLLVFLLVWAVVAGFALWERPTVMRGAVFSVVIGLSYFSHARALPIVIVAAIWLVALLWRRWRVAVVALIVLAAATLLVYQVSHALNAAVIEGGEFAQGEGFMDNLRDTRPGLILRALFGQAWYQVVSSFGLVVVGGVAVVAWCWREVRERRLGRACLVFGVVVGMFLLSVLAWSSWWNLYANPWRRLDAWVYGRYVDPFTLLLVVIGLAVIVRGVRRVVLWWSAAISTVVLGFTLLWVAPQAPTWGYVTPAHIPGVMPWAGLLPSEEFAEGTRLLPSLVNENRFWLIASLCAWAVVIVTLLFRSRPVVPAVVLLVAFAAGTIAADPASDSFHENNGNAQNALRALDTVEELTGPVPEVDFDRECRAPENRSPVAQNYMMFWLSPRALDLVYPSTDEFDSDVVFACDDWPLAAELGARAIEGSDGQYFSKLWVLPGERQDELEKAGVLE